MSRPNPYPRDSVTRADATRERWPQTMTPYRRAATRRYFASFATAKRVTFIEADEDRRYMRDPHRTEIIHAMARGGHWSKPQRTYFGAAIETEIEARKQVETAAKNRRAAARLQELRDAIPADARDCFSVVERFPGEYMLREHLHDVGGSFGWHVSTPEDVAQRVQRGRAGHESTYHPAPTGDTA